MTQRVEIRYFTSGVTWAADYVGIANEDETKINLTGYVRVTSGSGEEYGNAQTRLVVGNINLVEKHVKYFMDLKPGKKQTVEYSVTYKRRKAGPELNTEKKREPL